MQMQSVVISRVLDDVITMQKIEDRQFVLHKHIFAIQVNSAVS